MLPPEAHRCWGLVDDVGKQRFVLAALPLPGVVVGQEGCVDLGPVLCQKMLASKGEDLVFFRVHVLPLVCHIVVERSKEGRKAALPSCTVGVNGGT